MILLDKLEQLEGQLGGVIGFEIFLSGSKLLIPLLKNLVETDQNTVQKLIFILKVSIKRRTSDIRPIQYLLDRHGIVTLFGNQIDQRLLQELIDLISEKGKCSEM